MRATPEELWSFVADTNRFNYDAGLPAIAVSEDEAKSKTLRNARRRVKLSLIGIPLEWEEQPFEWVRPVRFGVTRTYSKGPLEELRVLMEMKPHDGGTHIDYHLWAKPKSLLGLIAIPVQLGLINGRRFGEAFRQYDENLMRQHNLADQSKPQEPSQRMLTRLEALLEKLVSDGTEVDLAKELIRYVEYMDDFSLARIRPYVLADQWKMPRRAVLEACLRATRAGLLDLRWDLLCPLCRGPQETGNSLRDISSKAQCETCQIDFNANFDRFVEISFSPNPTIRKIDVKDYCVGSPQRTPHIVVQQLIPAHTMRSLQLPLEEGSYHVRALGLTGEQLLNVSVAGSCSLVLTISSEGWSHEDINASTNLSLEIENTTDDERLFILERVSWSDQATTAAEVTALQIFRDLFASEALRPGEQISVGTLTVLFTDLRHSTQLYREIGDATAFGAVMNHFDVLRKAIAQEDGALIKTIGDAVMAVFREPAAALRAMLSAQKILASPVEGSLPLILKAGIHVGPCIAVTLNDRLDYFGSTVNIAARLESLSTGSDVVISGDMYSDPGVQEMLTSAGELKAASFQMSLKGFNDESFELWRVGRAQSEAAVTSASV